MRISDEFKEKSCVLSIEVFPSKKADANIESLYPTLESLRKLNPDDISVTYGAEGAVRSNSKLVTR